MDKPIIHSGIALISIGIVVIAGLVLASQSTQVAAQVAAPEGSIEFNLPNVWFSFGLGAIGLLGIAASLIPNNLKSLIFSEPNFGKISHSKLQVLIWTVTIVFTYVVVFGVRWFDPSISKLSLPLIPLNLFLLMGFSAATATGAKGIALRRESVNRVSSESDIYKFQMIGWTIIAAAIYVFTIMNYINNGEYKEATATLPDVDGTLLLLMGASQGAYLSLKGVSQADLPSITNVTALVTLPTTTNNVIIEGKKLGSDPGTIKIKFNDVEFPMRAASITASSWNENEVKFTLWQDLIDKLPSPSTSDLTISILTFAQLESNPIDFKVTKP